MESCFCALLRTGPNFKTSLFVDCWLSITKFCTEVNISILKQNKSTLWVLGEEISGNGISTIGKWKFTIRQDEMVSLSFHRHQKVEYFHLSIWHIGQGGKKFRRSPGFDSWQFAVQAEKCPWAQISDFLTWRFNSNLKWTDKTAILIRFCVLAKAK